MFKKILTSMLFVTGLSAGFALAQQGELVISQNYIKPGCSNWEFKEAGGTGAPSGGVYPRSYQIFGVTCNGSPVAKKTQLFYENGSLHSCRIDLINTTGYTLSSSSCASFEVRVSVPQPVCSTPNSGLVILTACGNSLGSQGAQQYIAQQCGACGPSYRTIGAQGSCSQTNPLVEVKCK